MISNEADMAFYCRKTDNDNNPFDLVVLSYPAVNYLADAALRSALDLQYHNAQNYRRERIIPFTNADDTLSYVTAVTVGPLLFPEMQHA